MDISFTEADVEQIEREIQKTHGLPWKLNQDRSQITPTNHHIIFSFSLEVNSGLRIEAQSNGDSLTRLYGCQLYGEQVADAVKFLYSACEARDAKGGRDE